MYIVCSIRYALINDIIYYYYYCITVMCPKGDDPVTDNQFYRKITLMVTTDSHFQRKLGITFQGSTTFISLNSPSSSDCKTQLELNPKFSEINCDYEYIDSKTFALNITFIKFPTQPYENNLYTHNGNPLITDFLCDISHTKDDVECHFSNVYDDNIKGK
jgi:hypothetical protein